MDEQPKNSRPPQPLNYSSRATEARTERPVSGFLIGMFLGITTPLVAIWLFTRNWHTALVPLLGLALLIAGMLTLRAVLWEKGFRMLGGGFIVGLCLFILVGGVACFVLLSHA